MEAYISPNSSVVFNHGRARAGNSPRLASSSAGRKQRQKEKERRNMIAAPTASRMVHFCPLPSESRAGVERGGAQTSELQCGTPSSSEEGGRSGVLRLFRAGVDESVRGQ
ncbi:hypothetical protein SRHO_G00310580 [Serrasalmus rhombeus]